MTSTTTVVPRPASPATPLAVDAQVDRSGAILQAAGVRLVPLAHPIGPWQLLGVSSQGLVLVAVVGADWPPHLGMVYGHPAGWPLNTRRVLHHYPPDAILPDVLSL